MLCPIGQELKEQFLATIRAINDCRPDDAEPGFFREKGRLTQANDKARLNLTIHFDECSACRNTQEA
jgi:hypothetical protein